jgi:hypothetical protein
VLGIDELDVVGDAGGATTTDAKVDSAATDASTADVTPITSKCASESDCPKCCHDDTTLRPGFGKLSQLAKTTGCICGAGKCGAANECGNDICMDSQTAPAMGCLPCVDAEIRPTPGRSVCADAKTQCKADSSCKAFLDCITSCK